MKSTIGAITRNWYGKRHSEPLASFLTKGRRCNARLPQTLLCNGSARHGETHDLVGSWAVKIARNFTGRRCNSFEADLWARTSTRRRAMLCPVLARLPFGVAILMPGAEPLSEAEAEHLRATRDFPDWDYVPPDDGEPFEYKASDWGDCQTVGLLRWIIRHRH
jgi:hypothetical protein